MLLQLRQSYAVERALPSKILKFLGKDGEFFYNLRCEFNFFIRDHGFPVRSAFIAAFAMPSATDNREITVTTLNANLEKGLKTVTGDK